ITLDQMCAGTPGDSRRDLLWLPAKRIVEALPYDEPKCGIHTLKGSLNLYSELLRVSGMNTFCGVPPGSVITYQRSHYDYILEALRLMRSNQDQCDLEIRVQGHSFHVHRTILASFSQYFQALTGSKTWKESRTGVLNMESTHFETPESVAFVV